MAGDGRSGDDEAGVRKTAWRRRRGPIEAGPWRGDGVGGGRAGLGMQSLAATMAPCGSGCEAMAKGRRAPGASCGALCGCVCGARRRWEETREREGIEQRGLRAGSRGGDRGHASTSRAGGRGAQNERERWIEPQLPWRRSEGNMGEIEQGERERRIGLR